jgi:hypothetical protein
VRFCRLRRRPHLVHTFLQAEVGHYFRADAHIRAAKISHHAFAGYRRCLRRGNRRCRIPKLAQDNSRIWASADYRNVIRRRTAILLHPRRGRWHRERLLLAITPRIMLTWPCAILGGGRRLGRAIYLGMEFRPSDLLVRIARHRFTLRHEDRGDSNLVAADRRDKGVWGRCSTVRDEHGTQPQTTDWRTRSLAAHCIICKLH